MSTSRMYQRQVSSRPRVVERIISSRVTLEPASKVRLSLGNANSCPESLAASDVYKRQVSTPSRSQSILSASAPLSYTDVIPGRDPSTMAKPGAGSAPGPLDSVMGSDDSVSPTLVVPGFAPANTVRPCSASRPLAVQYVRIMRSATALGGRIVSYRPAGSSIRFSHQASLWVTSAASASAKSVVAWPTHAEPMRAACLALSSTLPELITVRRRAPALVASHTVETWCSA